MEKIKRYDTNKGVKLPICIFYNQKVSLGSSGTLSLRKDSRNGEIIESFEITSDRILVSARELLVYPTNQLPYETNVHVTVSDGFVVSSMNGTGFTGLEEDGDEEFYFDTESPYGKPLEGGIVVSKDEGGYYWVSSPPETEINGSWNEISNIITKVSNQTDTTGWILPTKSIIKSQLIPNKDYWIDQDSQNNLYWANDEIDSNNSYYVNVNDGIPYSNNKEVFHKIRLFKKVVY